MTVLTPVGKLRHVAARCDRLVSSTPQVTAADLLEFINEGYKRACERSTLLDAYGGLTVPAGEQAVLLPGDLCEVLGVFAGGVEYADLGFQRALSGIDGHYYSQVAGTLQLPRAPEADVTLTVWYARTPTTLLTLDDELEPVFGWEWLYMLVAWCKYRIGLIAGDAQDAAYTIAKRQEFDAGVVELRAYAASFRAAGPRGMTMPGRMRVAR